MPLTDPAAGLTDPAAGRILRPDRWWSLRDDHAARVDALTEHHRTRSGAGQPHPVEDFLFTYYSLRPAQLRRWHPGFGVGLIGASERAEWRFQRTLDGGIVVVDLPTFLRARGSQLAFTRNLLGRTAAAPGQYGCFGLHEWAMVFGQDGAGRRHQQWPLRLGQDGTDQVVRDHQIKCTHYDAFRFFTPPARPLNSLQPSLEGRLELEQPGCLHASMDIYKWAYKLIPIVPSELLLDAFDLAKSIRAFDMRASPYDLAELGYQPVPIETAAGKAEYVAAQRGFAVAAQALRRRLLAVLQQVDAAKSPVDPAGSAVDAGRPAAVFEK